MKYLKLFENHTEYEGFVSGGTMVKPNVSHCIQENEVHYNPRTWADVYFTTVARENGTISFNIRFDMGTEYITSISYSTDNGETWNTTNNTNSKSENLVIDVVVNNGDKVLWKGVATQTGCWSPNEDVDDIVGSFFSSDCEFDAQGNVMSLFYGDNFKGETTIENDYAFCNLFYDYDREKNCGIVNAKDLSLPATTLADSCYLYMFAGCTSLTTAPELHATTLAQNCYSYMFADCTSLTTAPELPAETLADNCYVNMFYGCTSLTTTPELPAAILASSCYSYMFAYCTSLTTAQALSATTLAANCYTYMFQNCTNLTIAPQLPATTLAPYCYQYMFTNCTNLTTAPGLPATTLATGCYGGMFYGCTSLTTAPVLPATTLAWGCYDSMFGNCTSLVTAPQLPALSLAEGCYQNMFNGCTNLNYIKAMFTTLPNSTYTYNWVRNVAASGTFVKNAAATWNVTGVHGVPTGWTVQTATA